MWLISAVGSALFAGLTAILSKCGLKKTNSDVANALRTTVVLVMAWLVALIVGAVPGISSVSVKSWVFLILSGLATGASWLCYFKALSLGEVSKVTAIDKSSTVLSVILAITIFPAERAKWQLKLLFVALIGVGTFLMTDIKKGDDKHKLTYLIFAVLSAVFAAGTSILARIGIEGVDSNLATAIRTVVVLIMAWIIVFARKEGKLVKEIDKKEGLFLVLSGLATGASWLCYYYALQKGQVSVVVPIDKMSILITILFSLIVFKEKPSKKAWFGLVFLVLGTLLMAIFA